MSDNNDAQNFAIAESMRADIPELERMISLRKSQYDDARDPITKGKIAAYVELLGYAIKAIRELLEHVKSR